jgi:peptidoglycan hydrolase-like protein with peptidoglycan-binding domain
VVTPVPPAQLCPAFTQYLKKGMRDGKNSISEVSKVQQFLNTKLNLGLVIDGVFGSRTHNAVKTFQTTYSNQILNPWNLTGPTGWWYQSTRSYANYLENCSEGTVQLDNGIQVRDGSIQ